VGLTLGRNGCPALIANLPQLPNKAGVYLGVRAPHGNAICNSEPGRRWTIARRLHASDYWLISSPCQTFASISGGSPRSTMKRPRTQGARAIRLTRLVAGTHSGLGPPRNGGGLFYAGARSRRADRHIWCGAPPIDTRPRGPRPLASCSAPSVVWLYLLFGPPAASRGNRGTPPQHKVGGDHMQRSAGLRAQHYRDMAAHFRSLAELELPSRPSPTLTPTRRTARRSGRGARRGAVGRRGRPGRHVGLGRGTTHSGLAPCRGVSYRPTGAPWRCCQRLVPRLTSVVLLRGAP